jgi:hypothetical protein
MRLNIYKLTVSRHSVAESAAVRPTTETQCPSCGQVAISDSHNLSLEMRIHEQGHRIEAVFETIQHLIEAPGEEAERRPIGYPTSLETQENTK